MFKTREVPGFIYIIQARAIVLAHQCLYAKHRSITRVVIVFHNHDSLV